VHNLKIIINCIEFKGRAAMPRRLLLASIFSVISTNQAYGIMGSVCEPLIRQYEAAHGIPHKLLTAISLVESGRKVQGGVVAWPWTINANGKPYVFASKKEAITMVRKLRQIGVTSIDVGCMQVNLKQHPRAFSTLEAAFDPATNIAYAAKFLKAKKVNKGSWVSAVAHYHSSTAKFHLPYKTKVLKTWAKVQNGRMTLHGSLEFQKTSVEMIMSDLESHKGEIVNNVSAPSGRRVPMVVRFAPYRGFQKGSASKHLQLISTEATKGKGPKIIRGWAMGEVIRNKFRVQSYQKPIVFQNVETPNKVVSIAAKRKDSVFLRKPKGAAMSKFRAKSR
jgi:hypothetical protein